ncbi:hypothetical protein TL16_g00493 [Triparma laevis f. inornata]|uniref:Uncharacterized protein n=1 Tax=Triparma laevis f. inornata TaxID=1714386 RepID=A0A9W6ZDK6_9STRA|nr:hypothetical protein TL16_g00493 [Triparma laevis f. inornata]
MIIQTLFTVLTLLTSIFVYWLLQPLPSSFHPQPVYPQQGYSILEIGEDTYSVQTLDWGIQYTCPTTPSSMRPLVILFDRSREPESGLNLLKLNYCIITSESELDVILFDRSREPESGLNLLKLNYCIITSESELDGSILDSLLLKLYETKSTKMRITIKSSGIVNFWALSFISQTHRDRRFYRNMVAGVWVDGKEDETVNELEIANVKKSDLWRAYLLRLNRTPLFFCNTPINSILSSLLGLRFGGIMSIKKGVAEDVWVSTSDGGMFELLKVNNLNGNNNNLDLHPFEDGEEGFDMVLKRMGKRKKIEGGTIDFNRVTNLQGKNLGKGGAGFFGDWLGLS